MQQRDKDADYVYFERSTQGMSKNTLDAAMGAKLKLEHFYKCVTQPDRWLGRHSC